MSKDSEYDYVIVGAGSAGCVLAARLSEDPAVRVALVESGPRDRTPEIRIPAAFPKLFRTPYDWDYSTSKQSALDGRELYWPRGHTLGGSSSMNAMMWVRGHRDDYDAWGEAAGEEWSYEQLARFFQRAERWAGTWRAGLSARHPGPAVDLPAARPERDDVRLPRRLPRRRSSRADRAEPRGPRGLRAHPAQPAPRPPVERGRRLSETGRAQAQPAHPHRRPGHAPRLRRHPRGRMSSPKESPASCAPAAR